MAKKHVYVLSGFLGSGKTTLLKQLLHSLKDKGRIPAVLMNELGDISIDSGEIEEGTPMKELLNGCICCTIQDKLEAQLQELLLNEDFDDLIIETTGAAHPVEAIDAIMSPLFADSLEWKGIITIVDCLVWKRRQELSPSILQLLIEQIKHADLLILNKTDLVTEMEQGVVSFEVQQINAHALLYLTQKSKVPFTVLEKLVMEPKKDIQRVHAKFHLHLTVFSYKFTGSVELEEFEAWVRMHVDQLYRMKGYIPFTHSANPTLFQYSYGMPLYMPEEMKMPANLVVIGEGLDKAKLLSELKELETS